MTLYWCNIMQAPSLQTVPNALKRLKSKRAFYFELFLNLQALQRQSTINQTDDFNKSALILDTIDTNSTNTIETDVPEILEELNECTGNTVWLDYANNGVVLWFTVELVWTCEVLTILNNTS